MLVISRKERERIVITGPCVITICEIRRSTIRVGIEADRDADIRREPPDPEDNTNPRRRRARAIKTNPSF